LFQIRAGAAKDVGAVVNEVGRDIRIEGVPGPPVDAVADLLRPVDEKLEGGIHGDVDDAHRKRDLLAPCSTQRALAIPAVAEERQHAGYRRWSPVCSANIPTTLQLALIAPRASVAGSRRMIWALRSSRWASESSSDRTRPRKDSRGAPYMTG
jgi:hypothetical protein